MKIGCTRKTEIFEKENRLQTPTSILKCEYI